MQYVESVRVVNLFPALLAVLFSFYAIAACGAAEKERENELDLRQKAIAADLQALRERQKRQVPEAARKALNEKLKAIADKKGYNDANKGLFRLDYIKGLIEDQGLTTKPLADDNQKIGGASVVEGLKAFSDQLAERGIDLIVVPVGDNVLVHAWKVQDGISPEDDLWPGQTKALVALLENNVEVIDLAGIFRKHVAAGGDDPMNRFDHHWSGVGMQLIAKLLAERLQRYDFARAAVDDRDRFSVQKIDVQTPSQLISINGIAPHQEWADNMAKPEKWGLPPKSPAWQVSYDGKVLETEVMDKRLDPVLVMGDSNVFHLSGQAGAGGRQAGYGAGFPEQLSMALGLVVPQRAEADGARLMPRRYAERLAKEAPQPRVIVLAIGLGTIFQPWEVVKLPSKEEVRASATLVGLDSKTLGNWKGVYGADGYKIICDKAEYPAYASYGGDGQVFRTYIPVWTTSWNTEWLQCSEECWANTLPHIEERALLKASTNDGTRIAGLWVNYSGGKFGVDVKLQDGKEHQVALYLPDYGNHGNVMTVEVQECDTRKVLVPIMDVEAGGTGVYAVWNIKGHVRFLMGCKKVGPAVAGIFFDPVKGETITVDARVTFATHPPNPKTSTYKDALTTTVFAAEAAPDQKGAPATFSAIQWVMKDGKLLPPASDLAEGQRWRLTLTNWDEAIRKDKKLETIRRVDETEFDPDAPLYWIEKAERIK